MKNRERSGSAVLCGILLLNILVECWFNAGITNRQRCRLSQATLNQAV